jgi:hypothetical protein
MPASVARPTNQDRIKAALWFAGQGFGIFPVWSTDQAGRCHCPAGPGCTSPGKHPITHQGFRDATTDQARITTFLSAASEPNYGMTCPEGVFALDVDGDGIARFAELEARYGALPPTLRTQTANGQHVFLRWPDAYPRPIRQLFGFVTRWGSGQHAGYVIGPRSVHPTGVPYTPAEGTALEVATLPDAWAAAGVTPERHVTVASGPRLEVVHAGGRHEFLRDRARTLRGGGLAGEALFEAVMTVNAEYCDPPKTADEVRRAIGDVETKYEPDPLPGTPEAEERVSATEPPMMSPADDETLFPAPPGEAVFGGLLGDVAEFLLDGTDASPVAVTASLLAFCGALMPASGYWHGRHTSSPFLALVGKSGIGRKGTAMYRVRDGLASALGADTVNRVRFEGVASGEALVKTLLDRSQQTFGVPNGVLFEEEYATFLAATGRDGSNLDSRMRSVFDGKQLAHRKVGETIFVPEPYWLSGLVAITPAELQDKVPRASFKNGSGNRWLWLPVTRRDVRVVSSEPILPQDLQEAIVAAHRATIQRPAQLRAGDGVDDLLSEYDEFLRAESIGLAADMTRRFGVIAFRIGLVHASVERSGLVTREHVLRAIALTEYARSGLAFSFGDALGDASATHLMRMLLESDDGTLPQWVISKYFIRDPIKRQAAIDDLCRLGVAEVVKVSTRGRPATMLRLLPRKRDFLDFCALIGLEPKRESLATERGERGISRAEVRRSSVGDSAEGAQKVRRSAQKSGSWAHPCRDYAAHQDHHRRTGEGWTCDACHPEKEGEA